MDKQSMNQRLDMMWRSGHMEKEYVPFIKTAINRPFWTFRHVFVLQALAQRKPGILGMGLLFLWFRYQDATSAFLYKYFPGLVMFPYFEKLWYAGNFSEPEPEQPVSRANC